MVEDEVYVMLMMMRSDDSYEPSTAEGCSAEELLACFNADDYDACIAACSDEEPAEGEDEPEEVKAGTLKLSGEDVNYDSIPNAGLISFGKIRLTANSDSVTVRSITLKKTGGLGEISNTTRVFLEKNGVRISGKARFTDGEALITLTTPLVVKTTEELDLVFSLQESASEEFQFTATDVDCSAERISGSYTTKKLTTVNYPITQLTGNAISGTPASYKVDSSKLIEMGEISFQRSGTKSVTVKAITLNNSGTASLEFLKDAALYRDSVKVSTKTIVEGRTISFVLDDEIKSTDTSDTNYVVKAKIADADRIGDTYQLYVKNIEDINVVETETTFRATINLGDTDLTLISVKGSDLKLTETNVSALKVVPGAKKVKFFEGKIESSESVTLTTLKDVYMYTNNSVKFDEVLDNLYVKIGNQIVAVDTIISNTTGKFLFDSEFVVDGTAVFEIYGDIKSNAKGTVIQANPISQTNFAQKQFADGGNVESIMGSISSRKVTIVSASVSLNNTSPTSTNVQRGDKKVELGKLEYSTTSDINAKLYSFKAKLAGTNYSHFDGATVAVYDGDTLIASEAITAGQNTLSFSFDAIDITKTESANLSVILDKVPATVVSGDTLEVVFTGSVVKANNANQPVSEVNGTTLKVITGGSATVVSQGLSPKMILQGTANELGSLKLKAVNGNVTMTSVTLSGGADFASKATNVKLMKGETAVATFVKSGNVFVAEGLDETITLGNTSTYTVKATINEATKAADLLDPFTLEASATFESPYGAELDSLGYTAISDEITTVVAYPTITKIEGVKGSNYASLKVTFNSSKELQIPASSLTGVIGGNLTGLAGKTWTVGSTENGSQYDGEVITIDGPTSIYLTVAGLNWTTTSSSDPYINLGLTNFGMNSVFTDGSIAEHANILTRFRDVVTELTDLGVNIK